MINDNIVTGTNYDVTLAHCGGDNLNTGREGCELRFYFQKDSIGNRTRRTDVARKGEEAEEE